MNIVTNTNRIISVAQLIIKYSKKSFTKENSGSSVSTQAPFYYFNYNEISNILKINRGHK